MNREILFRGKRMDNGEWVYGDYHKFTCTTSGIIPTPTHYIMGTDVNFKGQTLVDPDTIGQYTGLTDKNGVKIFEGDICKSSLNLLFYVVWDEENARFIGFTIECERHLVYVGREPKVEIIGNIHDNPELLGVNDGTTD